MRLRDKIKTASRHLLAAITVLTAGVSLSACFHDEDPIAEQYKDWREQNEQYIAEQLLKKDDAGNPYYTKIVPSWAPETYVLVHWHNDRTLTSKNISPMDNSVTQITYELYDVEGTELSNSFSNTDSLYTSRPNQNIIGMWTALTYMNVGDTVTMIIPSAAGYGTQKNGDIKPYSTLVYGVKLKAVPAYEIP